MSGLEIIRAIQLVHSETLDSIALFVTDLHSETIYLLILPLLLWLYDKRFARYMTSVFLLGFWANNVLKVTFDTARPSPDDVRVVRPEPSGAFPSGHSQNPLMFWGALAIQANRAWFTVAMGVLIFAIGLSRLYIGVHWPLDILGGWTIGVLMLVGFEASRGFWVGENQSVGRRLFWAVVIPSLTFGLAAVVGGDAAEEAWLIAGAYLGFWVGGVLEDEFVGFDPRAGGLVAQVLKVVVGLAILLGVKEGFKLFLPETHMGDLVRYFFVTLSATFVAPWLFRRFVAATPAGRGVAR